jgi:hypothetical protein
VEDGRRPIDWNLFVDESGRFDDEDEAVAVAGVLVRADLPGARAEDLRESFRAELPFLPWPFHAAYYNHGAFVALAVAVHIGRGGHAEAWQERLACSAVERMHCVAPAALRAAMNAIEAGREPAYDALEELVRAADASTREAMAHLRKATRNTMARLVEGLARRGAEATAPAVAFVSSADGARREYEGRTERRYLEHVECLFERTHDLLRRLGGRHEVRLHVLQRDVDDPLLGAPSPMHLRQIRPLAVKLSTEDVWFEAVSVLAFDAAVHPLLVVADLAANRARAAFRLSGALTRVEQELGMHIRLPLRSGSPALSHAAATGAPREVAAGRADPSSLGPRHHPWAREQALEWSADPRSAR